MSITAILDLKIKPEELAGTPAVLRETLTATRNFDGNLGVEVWIDATDPAHIVVIEKWESIEADDAYRAWRQTPDGASLLGKLLAGAPSLTRLELAADI